MDVNDKDSDDEKRYDENGNEIIEGEDGNGQDWSIAESDGVCYPPKESPTYRNDRKNKSSDRKSPNKKADNSNSAKKAILAAKRAENLAEASQPISLLFHIPKNNYCHMENRFISVQKTRAIGWLMGSKHGVTGWHPHKYFIAVFCFV